MTTMAVPSPSHSVSPSLSQFHPYNHCHQTVALMVCCHPHCYCYDCSSHCHCYHQSHLAMRAELHTLCLVFHKLLPFSALWLLVLANTRNFRGRKMTQLIEWHCAIYLNDGTHIAKFFSGASVIDVNLAINFAYSLNFLFRIKSLK